MSLTQVCNKCKVDKPHSEYWKDKFRASKIKGQCKDCIYATKKVWWTNNSHRQKGYALKAMYGMSIEEFNSYREQQNFSCALCGLPELLSGKGTLYVDHCHTSGKVRALLCDKCNTGLGHFKEDVLILEKAIQYIKEHSG